MGTALDWGRHYLMVAPEHFRVDYAINPYMDPADQPDPAATREQWEAIGAAIDAAGGVVDVLPQRPDAPDMVYAMNLGLPFDAPTGPVAVLSHMRYAERRMETESAEGWFVDRGYTLHRFGRDGVGAHFEAGDAFAWRGELVVGHGPRTERLALKHLAHELGLTVRGVRITHARRDATGDGIAHAIDTPVRASHEGIAGIVAHIASGDDAALQRRALAVGHAGMEQAAWPCQPQPQLPAGTWLQR